MPPTLSSWALRITSRGGKIEDDFNRSLTGSLGSTSTGAAAWSILTGAWNVSGTKPTTATSQGSNPLAVVDMGLANVDLALTIGAGDALYFRVQDATNWWRALWEGYQTSSCQTCYQTCCGTCCDTCNGSTSCCQNDGGYPYGCGGCGACGAGSCPGCGGCCSTCGTGGGAACCTCYIGSGGSCSFSCNCYSCNCYSCNPYSCNCTYYDNYRMLLQKMVGGTLTTVSTGSVLTTATTRARVSLSGTTVSAYYGTTGQTLLSSTSQSDLAGKTKHGIGRGASSYNASAIDDFVLSWN